MRVASLAGALALAFPVLIGAQVAIVQLKVVEGDGVTHAAGGRSLKPLTVEVTDETGHAVAGAAVSFHFPEQGPSGLFVNGLRTDVVTSDAAGRATVRGFQLNHSPGALQIRITAAKDQARAGIISTQYVSDSKAGTAAVAPVAAAAPLPARPTIQPTIQPAIPPTTQPAFQPTFQPTVQPGVAPARHSGRKWVFVALIVAGAAAGATNAAGIAVAPGAINVDLTPNFAAYFAKAQFGGVFSLHAVFPVTGDSSQIDSVSAVLTNAAGKTNTGKIKFSSP